MTKPCSWCGQSECTCQSMKTSDIFYMFAQAHRQCGHPHLAESFEKVAIVKEAEETLNA